MRWLAELPGGFLRSVATLVAVCLLLAAPVVDQHAAERSEAHFGTPVAVSLAAVHPIAPLHLEASPEALELPCAFCLFGGPTAGGRVGAPLPSPHLVARLSPGHAQPDAPRATLVVTLPSRASPVA